jgi:hypothetical protein
MIDPQRDPLAWSMLMDEREDTHEHLGNLIRDMTTDEVDFRIQLAHVYAHLNRAWNLREKDDAWHDTLIMTDPMQNADYEAARAFPTDLEPIA